MSVEILSSAGQPYKKLYLKRLAVGEWPYTQKAQTPCCFVGGDTYFQKAL